MIIDKVPIAGLDAYFQDPNNPGQTNLAGQLTSRTKPLGKGKQLEISAIRLLIESADDLTDLFAPQPSPLFSISVMKEMLPALFANPFHHRVHNVSGFEDLKRGTLENARAMEVDGIPTIVSVGNGICKWLSPVYPMPEAVVLNHASWELAASRKTPSEDFTYSLELLALDENQSVIQTVSLANGADPTEPRKAESFDLQNVRFYQTRFSADIRRDASIYERHSAILGESIGTPLLRAVNLLEPVESAYDIYSLQELLGLSSDYHLFETHGQPLKKMLVTLDLSATLVQSENEDIPAGKYEFVEIAVRSDRFAAVTARLEAEILIRVYA